MKSGILFEEASLNLLIEMVQQGKIIVYAAGNHSTCLDNPYHLSAALQHPLLRKGLLVVGNLSTKDNRHVGYKSSVGSNYVSDDFRGNFIWVRGEDRYLDIVQCLVEGGLDPRARSTIGLSAIRFAEQLGHTEAAAYLKSKVSSNQESVNPVARVVSDEWTEIPIQQEFMTFDFS